MKGVPPAYEEIGWRNLWRNLRDTLLTALALALGLTLLLIFLGLLDGSQEQMITNAVRLAPVISATEAFLHTDATKHVVHGARLAQSARAVMAAQQDADDLQPFAWIGIADRPGPGQWLAFTAGKFMSCHCVLP
jgi:ABC-type lipoprotein release transport system permease subunit